MKKCPRCNSWLKWYWGGWRCDICGYDPANIRTEKHWNTTGVLKEVRYGEEAHHDDE